jgi:DNA-binding response OmpR family regulator
MRGLGEEESMGIIRVLCIEDDAETRILIKRGLEQSGFAVDAVWGGERGLAAAMQGRFDCVLLDVMMPGIDGLQVLRMLKTQGMTEDLPVVMVSARDDEDTRRRAKAAGAVDFVAKPFQIKQLVQAVQAAVAKRAEHDG